MKRVNTDRSSSSFEVIACILRQRSSSTRVALEKRRGSNQNKRRRGYRRYKSNGKAEGNRERLWLLCGSQRETQQPSGSLSRGHGRHSRLPNICERYLASHGKE